MNKLDYNPIICAIDENDLTKAEALISELKDHVGAIKLGLEFFLANGFQGVQKISDLGVPVFLDLKLHDIPNTVSKALSVIKDLNLFMTTIHLSGGFEMVTKAIETLEGSDTTLLCVTSLTSLTDEDVLNNIQYMKVCGADIVKNYKLPNKKTDVEFFRHLTENNRENLLKILKVDDAQREGFNCFNNILTTNLLKLSSSREWLTSKTKMGFVCPAKAASMFGNFVNGFMSECFKNNEFEGEFQKPVIVSPGIRPSDSNNNDQKQISTPKDAINNGVDYMVIGRPITQSENKAEAAEKILEEINN